MFIFFFYNPVIMVDLQVVWWKLNGELHSSNPPFF